MSRSEPILTNPATKFFRWKNGKINYYDKEKQEQIEIKLPFEFLPIDQLATITGFSDEDQSSYWSNEVRSISNSVLNVKTSKGTREVGKYNDLTYTRSKGAKYAKSIYLVYEDQEVGEYVIGNLQASGAALTAWIEFSKQYKVENGKVAITGSTEAKKGTTTYYVPVFEYIHSTPEEDKEAIKLDRELQIYLKQYLNDTSNTGSNEEISKEELNSLETSEPEILSEEDIINSWDK